MQGIPFLTIIKRRQNITKIISSASARIPPTSKFKMQKIAIIAVFCLGLALAFPSNLPPVQPKPEDRQRETSYKVVDPGVLSLQHRETVYKDDNQKIDATAILNKNLVDSKFPLQVGGKVDYKNLNLPNTGASVQALNAGRFGTQVGAEATYNVYKGRNSALDLGANYGQSFGGAFGRSEPVFGGFVRATF